MKKAGELLSSFFDEPRRIRIQLYADLTQAWEDLHKTAGTADHTRIVHFERNILLIEADHPTWIYWLQLQQRELLREFQRRFPKIGMTGLAFRLSRGPLKTEEIPEDRSRETGEESLEEKNEEGRKNEAGRIEKSFDKMDPKLRHTFTLLKQHIRRRSKERGE
ncbi:MAG: DUF721 domain-containing protein [Spirochaetaceae bacterium]|jgi:hypothetical protein|nr:DUF721 domain-containing protein [Spirochaetaceae bacterium]